MKEAKQMDYILYESIGIDSRKYKLLFRQIMKLYIADLCAATERVSSSPCPEENTAALTCPMKQQGASRCALTVTNMCLAVEVPNSGCHRGLWVGEELRRWSVRWDRFFHYIPF